MKKVLFLLIIVVSFSTISQVHAVSEPIFITISALMEEVIFDGKWTYFFEWKPSSYNKLVYEDGNVIHLRTAHYGDFIYIFIDAAEDLVLDKNADKATVCFDSDNNKSVIPESNDYCFSVSLGQNTGTMYQGDSLLSRYGNFEKINNHEDFLAASSVSDENDRYSKIPHPGYEFRIPINLLERSDNYGFYMSVYEANSKKYYSWPTETKRDSVAIPSPVTWGDIVSPDKSIPEFGLPLLTMIPALIAIIYVTRRHRIGTTL